MNNVIESFMKRAQECGLTEKQAQAFLNKHVSPQQEKKAATLDSVVTEILKTAGLPKNDQSVAYTQGILKAGVDAGLSMDNAIKAATNMIYTQVQQGEKQAADKDADNKLKKYAEGFMQAAVEKGFTPGQSYSLLAEALRQKQADAPPMLNAPPPGNSAGAGLDAMSPPPGAMPPPPGGQGGGQEGIMQLLAGLLGGQGQGAPQPPPAGMGGANSEDMNAIVQLLQNQGGQGVA